MLGNGLYLEDQPIMIFHFLISYENALGGENGYKNAFRIKWQKGLLRK